jgi:hypothetical protein
MNRVWVKETRNCICGIVADKLFVPNRFDEFLIFCFKNQLNRKQKIIYIKKMYIRIIFFYFSI